MTKSQQQIDDLKADIQEIKDNHLFHLKSAVEDLTNNLSKIATDMEWVKQFLWLVLGATLTASLAIVVELLVKK